nr:MAG TPA: hypothetical protein [Caudoviricetes sp.]
MFTPLFYHRRIILSILLFRASSAAVARPALL